MKISNVLNLGMSGIFWLTLCLLGGLILPVLTILGVGAWLDGHYITMAIYMVIWVSIFYLLDIFWRRLTKIWKSIAQK